MKINKQVALELSRQVHSENCSDHANWEQNGHTFSDDPRTKKVAEVSVDAQHKTVITKFNDGSTTNLAISSNSDSFLRIFA